MKIRFRLTRKRVMLLVGVVALVATGAAVAVTSNAYTDANGVYHGCVGTDSGVLRVLASGQSCRANEAAIDWNQAGPKGDQGIQGIQGIQGPKGEKGDQGDQGIQGVKGDKGDTGLTGERGSDGAAGVPGEKGDKGDQGIQGIAGIDGIAGTDGAPGADGQDGAVGATGPPGPQGEKGDKGDPGTGSGVSGYEVKTASTPNVLGTTNLATATCSYGKVALGGGFSVHGGVAGTRTVQSEPLMSGGSDGLTPTAIGWWASATFFSETISTVTVYVICANAA